MSIIEFIRDRARYYNCPVCGRSLRGCAVRMLRHVEDRYTVQVTCAACQVQFIVILKVSGQSIEAFLDEAGPGGLDIDLDADPDPESITALAPTAPAFETEPAEPISSDEVLDVHLLLKGFRGRLTELLQQPSSDRH